MERRHADQDVEPRPWSDQAACRGWGGSDFADDQPYLPTAEARAACARCPVRELCLTYALEHRERWGLWGGLTTREREALRRNRALPTGVTLPFMGTRGPRATPPPKRGRT